MATKSERFGEVDVSRKIQDGRRSAIFYRTEPPFNRVLPCPKTNTLAKLHDIRSTPSQDRANTTRMRRLRAVHTSFAQDGRRRGFSSEILCWLEKKKNFNTFRARGLDFLAEKNTTKNIRL